MDDAAPADDRDHADARADDRADARGRADARDGGAVSPARVAEVERVLARVERWSARRPDVVAVGLAGSWAAGVPRPGSDVDLVVLTTTPQVYVATTGWVTDVVPGGCLVRTARWGPVVERRVALPGGLEIEFGFTAPGWAATDPVDPGTARVVTDGFQIRYDPDGVLARLVTAVRRPGPRERFS